ncbi:BMP family ABC transporter substrate-binding protein [Marinovum sp. 2_MG-2023]|uniref:BMP family ABC transporter substrate-binding protein n=1 Tax=Roseobacteraceae TaxID=2854170 RepID=UPI001FD52A77|nr:MULTISPECIES: BMP family ABC transporter substrate-binding protein [Roseobacteraceae]MCJ7873859.1 BMP family ABC transporter substrate-binding protein [Phaeobacter sp. J2-8]MDO6731145.1 BMP family ABC transporter substrate-binding protein [Marinovum sp. 2_MG-2023]MDO6778642.1 BMP family ABC transporter substrate-binding protein [Marinovum sp. 1_MG-2023]
MTPPNTMNRRRFLGTSAMALGATSLGLAQSAQAQSNLTVGFIYVGPKDDFGYNQAHAEGAAAVKAMSGVTVLEEENVPESQDVQNTMESMINFDGASLLFPTSFGYFNPHILEVAPKYPDVRFEHCGGLWTEGNPTNAGSYFGYIGMGQYLNGVTAGHATKSKKIGFVAAKPIPQVLNNINSFLLGARSVDPTITCQVIFTGEWSLAVKEAEATNALTDQGCDVITCHVDGPKVVCETAAARDAFVCGYHADQSPLAGDKYLTGAEWNWASIYTDMVSKTMAGAPIDNFVRGGLADNFIKMSPLGPAVSDAARAQFEATKAEIIAGGFAAIKGPLKDNKGNVIAAEGQSFVETDVAIESMGYLVEGVIGSTS